MMLGTTGLCIEIAASLLPYDHRQASPTLRASPDAKVVDRGRQNGEMYGTLNTLVASARSSDRL
jgi:hypothetical protein